MIHVTDATIPHQHLKGWDLAQVKTTCCGPRIQTLLLDRKTAIGAPLQQHAGARQGELIDQQLPGADQAQQTHAHAGPPHRQQLRISLAADLGIEEG